MIACEFLWQKILHIMGKLSVLPASQHMLNQLSYGASDNLIFQGWRMSKTLIENLYQRW